VSLALWYCLGVGQEGLITAISEIMLASTGIGYPNTTAAAPFCSLLIKV